MLNFDLKCHALRTAGFRIAYVTHLRDGSKSIVWLENGLKVFIYKDKLNVFVRGKRSSEHWAALRRIQKAVTPVTYFFD